MATCASSVPALALKKTHTHTHNHNKSNINQYTKLAYPILIKLPTKIKNCQPSANEKEFACMFAKSRKTVDLHRISSNQLLATGTAWNSNLTAACNKQTTTQCPEILSSPHAASHLCSQVGADSQFNTNTVKHLLGP